MKTKRIFGMDERNREIALRVIAVMYFLTLIALQVVLIYRQFILGQSINDFEDLAIILTVNSIFLISALLFFGAVPIQRIKIRFVLLAYVLVVVLGSIFTYLKYNVFLQANLSMPQILDKISIVSAVSGLLVLFFVLFSLLGRKRMQKSLE